MQKYRVTYLSLVGVLKVTLPALLLIMCFCGVLVGVAIGDIVNTSNSWVWNGFKYGGLMALAAEVLIIVGAVIANAVLRISGGLEIEIACDQQQNADM